MQAPLESRRLCDILHAAIVTEHPASPRSSGGRGPWVGIGERVSVHAAPTSWMQARRALRFASSTVYGQRAVEFGRLGPLELLADVPLERLLETRGVARINALAASAAGDVRFQQHPVGGVHLGQPRPTLGAYGTQQPGHAPASRRDTCLPALHALEELGRCRTRPPMGALTGTAARVSCSAVRAYTHGHSDGRL
ncbi:hypothetical protein [Streptomyces sp. NPDC001275]